MPLAIAACCGMLGRHEEARAAIESLRKYNATFLDLENVREEIARWDPDEDEVERLMQGLQKAGLKYETAKHGLKHGSAESAAANEEAMTPVSGTSPSSASQVVAKADFGAARAAAREDDGFWIAVLPFKHTGGNNDLKALAEGLSEEVITGLSRFS